MASLYDYPKYYDLIFNTDWEQEFNFLEQMFAEHATGEVERLFEPACGTGRLIFRFADAGYEIAGNDLNTQAVEFCNQRLRQNNFAPTAIVGDMTDFHLNQTVDAAFNTINSFRHLTTEKLAIAHLKCMAAAIRPGGIYVLGFHLTPTQIAPTEEEYWTASEEGIKVDSGMWLRERNLRSRYEIFGISFDVQTPTKQFRIEDEFKFRTYTAAQAKRLFAKVDQFETVGIYDFCYDAEDPIELDSTVEDAIFVLKRK